MKKVFALICTVVFLFSYAICEEDSQILPEEIVEVETIIEELPAEETLEEPIIEEPTIEEIITEPEQEIIEEPIVESTTAPIEEVAEDLIETTAELPVEISTEEEIEEQVEEIIEEEEIVEEKEEKEIIEEEEIEEEEEETPKYAGKLKIELIQAPHHFGDTAILQLTLVDYPPIELLEVIWEYSEDNVHWHELKRTEDLTIEIIVTKENYKYWYRGSIVFNLKEE